MIISNIIIHKLDKRLPILFGARNGCSMRDGITTAVSKEHAEAMRQSSSNSFDDRSSLARAFDPAHPYGASFEELKPYQYSRHPQECYGPQKALAGRGWCNHDQAKKPTRGRAVRGTDWGTRHSTPVQSGLDLAGRRDDPGEAGYHRGPVQVGPGTARVYHSLQSLKPYCYGGPPKDFRNTLGFITRAEASRLPSPKRGKAARRTDWGTRQGAPVMSDIDLAGGRDNPGEAGYNRGAVQVGPGTARVWASLADLKPYCYGGAHSAAPSHRCILLYCPSFAAYGRSRHAPRAIGCKAVPD